MQIFYRAEITQCVVGVSFNFVSHQCENMELSNLFISALRTGPGAGNAVALESTLWLIRDTNDEQSCIGLFEKSLLNHIQPSETKLKQFGILA